MTVEQSGCGMVIACCIYLGLQQEKAMSKAKKLESEKRSLNLVQVENMVM